MKFVQIKKGQKLHIVYEPGEGKDDQHLIKAGFLSSPICGRGFDENGNFRLTTNLPMEHACKNCIRVLNKKQS